MPGTLTVNRSCPIRRSRRSQADMAKIRDAIYDTCYEHEPLSVRQLFYRLTVVGVIDKTDADYKNVVCRISGQMRDAGELPFEWIVDSSRWMRKPTSFSSLDEALRRTAQTYRRTLSPRQIVDWQLPTRPTKKTDSRSKNFKGESVEVDAIEPERLRELVRDRTASSGMLMPMRLKCLRWPRSPSARSCTNWRPVSGLRRASNRVLCRRRNARVNRSC